MLFNLHKAIPDIPPKNYNCLIRNGITTYEAFADMTDEDISRLKGVHDIKGLIIVRDKAREYMEKE